MADSGKDTGVVLTPKTAPLNIQSDADRRITGGADWFFWIAGLSVINSILIATNSDWAFFLSLGITQVITVWARELSWPMFVPMLFTLVLAAPFVLFGIFARKRHTWAFITGMALYGMDSVLFLIAQDWLGFGFHLFALFFIFRGLKSLLASRKAPVQSSIP